MFKRGSLERQVTKLPKEVVWCKRCVVSNQRPRVIFNEDSVCSGCLNADYKNNVVDWEKREEELHELLESHRSKDGSWDVIVPSSGGKDSVFVSHQLKFKYRMNPLTVTWAPLEYTKIGRQNLDSSIKAGLPNFLFTPNGNFQRKLARLCFEELGDAFHVFVLGQVCFPFHMALKFRIPLVFYGENGEAEYAGDPEGADKPYKSSKVWSDHFFKGSSLRELIQYGLDNKDYLNEEDFTEDDLKFYEPPSEKEMEDLGIKGKHFFSYYKKWLPQENFYYAAEHTGFRPNPERNEGTYSKYASLDDKMDGFHYFLRYIKFGLGRCVDDAAHEIRDDHITREEAVALMDKYEGEFPEKYYTDFLEYLNIDQSHFWDVVDEWRAEHLWVKEGNYWRLRNPVE